MAAPPLPEAFGNYAIEGIAEVLPPAPVSWLPVTTGWQVLALLALGLAGWFAYRRLVRWRRNRYRREALRELAELQQLAPAQRLDAIAVVLKATALRAWPRQEVAALSGTAWTGWLASAGAELSDASRELLAGGQYRVSAPIDEAAVERLQSEVAGWIRSHREAAP